MKLYYILLAGVFPCVSARAATDPFVGKWVYNAEKSPKPTIRYTIKDLGEKRYSLTGSTGITVVVKADGVPIRTPAGATVSLRKLDERNWEMRRDDGQEMVRTFTISLNDKTLTLHDVFSGTPEANYETTTRYARLGPGAGILGEWQSVSIEETTHGKGLEMTVMAFGPDGPSFSIPVRQHLSQMRFDGKLYPDSGAGDRKENSSSGKRVSDSVLEIDSQVNGRLEARDELKVSNDGRTLTVVSKPANSTAVFTEIWDKQ